MYDVFRMVFFIICHDCGIQRHNLQYGYGKYIIHYYEYCPVYVEIGFTLNWTELNRLQLVLFSMNAKIYCYQFNSTRCLFSPRRQIGHVMGSVRILTAIILSHVECIKSRIDVHVFGQRNVARKPPSTLTPEPVDQCCHTSA